MNWLLRWQHLAPGTQLFGEHGTLEAVRQIGIVFRELLACESILPKWRELLMILRRLEDRGEVRGGRFVSGFWESSSRYPWRSSLCAPCATSSHPARRYLSRR